MESKTLFRWEQSPGLGKLLRTFVILTARLLMGLPV
jgi:hypothetical protein